MSVLCAASHPASLGAGGEGGGCFLLHEVEDLVHIPTTGAEEAAHYLRYGIQFNCPTGMEIPGQLGLQGMLGGPSLKEH